MLDIGWTEILIILGLAVIIVGPKDLPKIVRTIGKWRGKMSAYARDFQRSIEDAADVSEVDAIKKEIAEANRELNDANRDLKEQTAGVQNDIAGDMASATKDTTIVRLNSDGSVTEPGALDSASAPANKGNGEARPDGAAGGQTAETSATDTQEAKPGESRENSANA